MCVSRPSIPTGSAAQRSCGIPGPLVRRFTDLPSSPEILSFSTTFHYNARTSHRSAVSGTDWHRPRAHVLALWAVAKTVGGIFLRGSTQVTVAAEWGRLSARTMSNPIVFFEMEAGGEPLGRIEMEVGLPLPAKSTRGALFRFLGCRFFCCLVRERYYRAGLLHATDENYFRWIRNMRGGRRPAFWALASARVVLWVLTVN